MSDYIRGKDGKFAGRVGTGKRKVPTAATAPSMITPRQVATPGPNYVTLHAAAQRSLAATSATEATASQLHDLWRASRQLPDGTYEPRWKDDGVGGQVDIANTAYADLPETWKAENRAAAQSAIDAILADPDAGLETLAEAVHEDWLNRNGDWAPPEQALPYPNLDEEEKEKDRVVVRAALAALSRGGSRASLLTRP